MKVSKKPGVLRYGALITVADIILIEDGVEAFFLSETVCERRGMVTAVIQARGLRHLMRQGKDGAPVRSFSLEHASRKSTLFLFHGFFIEFVLVHQYFLFNLEKILRYTRSHYIE